MNSSSLKKRRHNQTEGNRYFGLPEFQPLPFLKSGLGQTLAAGLWPYIPEKRKQAVHKILLDDGDTLAIVESRPASWQKGMRIVVLVHGLGGNHQSNYMVRAARKLVQSGILVLRVNLRGCGIGLGLAKNPYHSGRSEDLRSVIEWAAKKFPSSPVTQVGYSLGGNITLKMAGEDGRTPSGNLDSVIAISPPVDLAATARHLRKSGNRFFDQFFVYKLKYDIWRNERLFPDLPKTRLPFRMKLTDIDDLYTAPRSGFKNAQHYYTQSSCGPLIPDIAVPGLILCSYDDPIVHAQSYKKVSVPPNINLIMIPSGGHVGFIGETGNTNEIQWMDCLIHNWIERISKNQIENPKKKKNGKKLR